MDIIAQILGELIFSGIVEFTDMIDEETIGPEAKHRHLCYWGGWLSCLLTLVLTGLLLAGAVYSLIGFMKTSQPALLILVLALYGVGLIALWRLYKSIRTMLKVTPLYFAKQGKA